MRKSFLIFASMLRDLLEIWMPHYTFWLLSQLARLILRTPFSKAFVSGHRGGSMH